MTFNELSRELTERQERAEAIVSRLQKLNWDVTLNQVLKGYSIFDRWMRGLTSTGYLAKQTGIHRRTLTPSTYDSLAALKRSLEANSCECPGVMRAMKAIEPFADEIRSIQCEGCSKILYTKDVLSGTKPARRE